MDLQTGLAVVERAFELCCGCKPNIVVGKARLVIEGKWSLMVNDKGRWMLYIKSPIPDEVRRLRDDPSQLYDYVPFKKDPKPLSQLLHCLLLQYSLRRLEVGLQQVEAEYALDRGRSKKQPGRGQRDKADEDGSD